MKKELSKFVKFPLVLGLVGLICGAALGTVNEITAPIIAQMKNKATLTAIQDIMPEAKNVEIITETLDSSLLNKYGVSAVYEISTDNQEKAAYGYQSNAQGYSSTPITFLLVIDAEDEQIKGYKTISHAESPGDSLGKALLESSEFATQFKNLAFDNVDTSIDFKAGSTAVLTLNGIKNSTANVVQFHREAILGEAGIEIDANLSISEYKKLKLEEGQTLVNGTNEILELIATNYSKDIEWAKGQLGKDGAKSQILDFIKIVDSSETTVMQGFVCKSSNKSVDFGSIYTKFVYLFDTNWENGKFITVSSTDTACSPLNPVWEQNDELNNLKNIGETNWIKQFNDSSMNELLADTYEIETLIGATFITSSIKDTISLLSTIYEMSYGY